MCGRLGEYGKFHSCKQIKRAKRFVQDMRLNEEELRAAVAAGAEILECDDLQGNSTAARVARAARARAARSGSAAGKQNTASAVARSVVRRAEGGRRKKRRMMGRGGREDREEDGEAGGEEEENSEDEEEAGPDQALSALAALAMAGA